jgi:hypothetical protein
MDFQPVAPGGCGLDRGYTVFQDNVMDGVFELQARQPPPVHQRPGWSSVMVAVPE